MSAGSGGTMLSIVDELMDLIRQAAPVGDPSAWARAVQLVRALERRADTPQEARTAAAQLLVSMQVGPAGSSHAPFSWPHWISFIKFVNEISIRKASVSGTSIAPAPQQESTNGPAIHTSGSTTTSSSAKINFNIGSAPLSNPAPASCAPAKSTVQTTKLLLPITGARTMTARSSPFGQRPLPRAPPAAKRAGDGHDVPPGKRVALNTSIQSSGSQATTWKRFDGQGSTSLSTRKLRDLSSKNVAAKPELAASTDNVEGSEPIKAIDIDIDNAPDHLYPFAWLSFDDLESTHISFPLKARTYEVQAAVSWQGGDKGSQDIVFLPVSGSNPTLLLASESKVLLEKCKRYAACVFRHRAEETIGKHIYALHDKGHVALCAVLEITDGIWTGFKLGIALTSKAICHGTQAGDAGSLTTKETESVFVDHHKHLFAYVMCKWQSQPDAHGYGSADIEAQMKYFEPRNYAVDRDDLRSYLESSNGDPTDARALLSMMRLRSDALELERAVDSLPGSPPPAQFFPHQKLALCRLLAAERAPCSFAGVLHPGWIPVKVDAALWGKAIRGLRELRDLIALCHWPTGAWSFKFFDAPRAPSAMIASDEPGMGKTAVFLELAKQGKALDAKLREQGVPEEFVGRPTVPCTLLIAPLLLKGQLKDELKLWGQGLEHLDLGRNASSARRSEGIELHHVEATVRKVWPKDLVVVYHSNGKLDCDERELLAVRWSRLIVDEAHFLHNDKGHLASLCAELAYGSVFLITATPIGSRQPFADLRKLVDFLNLAPFADDQLRYIVETSFLSPEQKARIIVGVIDKCFVRSTKRDIKLEDMEEETYLVDALPEEKRQHALVLCLNRHRMERMHADAELKRVVELARDTAHPGGRLPQGKQAVINTLGSFERRMRADPDLPAEASKLHDSDLLWLARSTGLPLSDLPVSEWFDAEFTSRDGYKRTTSVMVRGTLALCAGELAGRKSMKSTFFFQTERESWQLIQFGLAWRLLCYADLFEKDVDEDAAMIAAFKLAGQIVDRYRDKLVPWKTLEQKGAAQFIPKGIAPNKRVKTNFVPGQRQQGIRLATSFAHASAIVDRCDRIQLLLEEQATIGAEWDAEERMDEITCSSPDCGRDLRDDRLFGIVFCCVELRTLCLPCFSTALEADPKRIGIRCSGPAEQHGSDGAEEHDVPYWRLAIIENPNGQEHVPAPLDHDEDSSFGFSKKGDGADDGAANDVAENPADQVRELRLEFGTKVAFAASLIRARLGAIGKGYKALVYSSHKEVCKNMKAALTLVLGDAVDYVYHFEGGAEDRARMLVAMNSSASVVLIMEMKEETTCGLHFPLGHEVYFLDPPPSPNMEEQAKSRIHRLGQTKVTRAIRLYLELDGKISVDQALYHAVRGPGSRKQAGPAHCREVYALCSGEAPEEDPEQDFVDAEEGASIMDDAEGGGEAVDADGDGAAYGDDEDDDVVESSVVDERERRETLF
ncbi:P-loop containing nucleoside triphosphate hydrolase protein [Hyaloraphidium curvatum]|nr:P-loop containing nucleoside triphosphate hydrolase protein [Hyaloraphidium curvatum]